MGMQSASGDSNTVEKLTALVAQGIDYRESVRAALLEVTGKTPTEVMLRLMPERAMDDPVVLASAIERHFGAGAREILDLILSKASNTSGKGSESLESIAKILQSLAKTVDSEEGEGRNLKPGNIGNWRSLEDWPQRKGVTGIADTLMTPSENGGKVTMFAGSGFAIDVGTWREMKLVLSANGGDGSRLKELFYEYGRAMGKKITRMLGSESDLTLDTVKQVTQDAGWGHITVTGDRVFGTDITFEFEECIFCEEDQPSKMGCAELVGFVRGMTEQLYGERKVIEVGCREQGNHSCVVRAESR